MTITIASGKGGTGKTTLAVNLAYALASHGEQVRLLDCDVEEPDDHLFLNPVFTDDRQVTVPKPVWNPETCTACGKCATACNYNAIAVVKEKVLVFNELCHSCGVCAHVCPEGAISERDTPVGRVQAAPRHDPFFFAHGLLDIGEALAPNVVRAVKEHSAPDAINIIDAAPGTACPVVEAVSDADAVLLVTEPTPFGLNDLKLAVALALKANIPTGIVINRSDGKDAIIADYAAEAGLPITGRIPFRRAYAEAYSEGGILVQRFPELNRNMLQIFENIPTTVSEPVEDAQFSLPEATDEPLSRGAATTHREVTVISGKGGTGKTTLTAALARLEDNKILADNDVDAADLHLLLAPAVRESHDFVGGRKATILPDRCIGCGKCADACHFDAIRLEGPGNGVIDHTYLINPLACEGCGLCPRICPADAISIEDSVTGRWYVSSTMCDPMVHARLGIAEENSGRLVTQVRNRADQLAGELQQGLVLGDGPPGTGCPVIASLSGTDLVVIVTEPTVSGVHDMQRVIDLAHHFGVPATVVINKADLNPVQSQRIEDIARRGNAAVIGRIPFDKQVNDALMAGQTVVDYADGPPARAIREIWSELRTCLANPQPQS